MKQNTTSELILSQNDYNRLRRLAQEAAIIDLTYNERKELSDFVERTRFRKKLTALFIFVEGVLTCARTPDDKTWFIRKNITSRLVFSLDNGQELYPLAWAAEYEKYDYDSEKNNNVYLSKHEICSKG